MKRIIFVFLLLSAVFIQVYSDGETNTSYNSLTDFFGATDFNILSEEFVTGNQNFKMAVHYVNEKLKVYDKAIIYSVEEEQIVPRLILKDFIFYDSNSKVIYDFSDTLYNLKGFSSKFLYPDRPQVLSGLELDGHFEETLYTSDPFYIDWDPQQQLFKKYEVNWDER